MISDTVVEKYDRKQNKVKQNKTMTNKQTNKQTNKKQIIEIK